VELELDPCVVVIAGPSVAPEVDSGVVLPAGPPVGLELDSCVVVIAGPSVLPEVDT
jgi:hypothetical protein